MAAAKISRLKVFVDFVGQGTAAKFNLRQNFKFITDARHGWKLDHENFTRKNLFLSRIRQTAKYLSLVNVFVYYQRITTNLCYCLNTYLPRIDH